MNIIDRSWDGHCPDPAILVGEPILDRYMKDQPAKENRYSDSWIVSAIFITLGSILILENIGIPVKVILRAVPTFTDEMVLHNGRIKPLDKKKTD